MKILARSLAIIAFLVLGAQIVRHAYILWFEPRGSVLDKYDQPLKGQITNARSLDELLSRYDPVHKEADQARLQNPNSDRGSDFLGISEVEPFRSETMLRNAIKDWEEKSKEVYSLKFYWIVGFFCLAMGAIIFKWANRWLGLTTPNRGIFRIYLLDQPNISPTDGSRRFPSHGFRGWSELQQSRRPNGSSSAAASEFTGRRSTKIFRWLACFSRRTS